MVIDDVAAANRLTGLDLDLFDRARLLGDDVVLHLHRLENEHGLAGLDGLTSLDQHLDDVPCMGTATSPEPEPTTPAAAVERRLGLRRVRRRQVPRRSRTPGSTSTREASCR